MQICNTRSSELVAAQHRFTTEAGADVLRAGGNAVVCAVATSFAAGVLEPWISVPAGGGAAYQWGRPGIDVSACIVCGGPMRIIVGMPNHSIEAPMVIGKIVSHLEATSCAPPEGAAKCGVGARAPSPGSC